MRKWRIPPIGLALIVVVATGFGLTMNRARTDVFEPGFPGQRGECGDLFLLARSYLPVPYRKTHAARSRGRESRSRA